MNKNCDQLLSIQTKNIRLQTSELSEHYSPYEATPYPILQALFQSYQLTDRDVFVDFGCGKGRIIFLVHYLFTSSVVGIEMNEQLYETSLQNKRNYLKNNRSERAKISIIREFAETYRIQNEENIFYFFNPFSIDVFAKVIENILHSYERKRRTIDLIFYYPRDEYINYLKEQTPFKIVKEVEVPGLYEINKEERFLIYRLHI